MTPAASPSPIDRDTVQRLVAEVIRRIQAEAKTAPVTTATAHASPAAAPASSYGAPEPKAAAATLSARVITLHSLERLPAGTRQVVVDAKAVVTPSARDYAKEAGIAIMRGAASGSPVSAPPSRPFLIAHAQCANDPAAKAAAIARAVPGSQQLPPSGLADLVTAIATHASRDAARGILLTSRPAVAAILANRSASLRAVTGRDAASLSAASTDCHANLLIVDPKAFTGGLERLCTDFANRPTAPLPSELAAAPTGCGCKSH
ncbi:MAG: hypothetical protein WCC69_02005 [Pirellulales bacterium]